MYIVLKIVLLILTLNDLKLIRKVTFSVNYVHATADKRSAADNTVEKF